MRRRPQFQRFVKPKLGPSMRKPRNPKARPGIQIEKDDAIIADMYRKGSTLYTIGKAIGLSTKQVCRRMDKIRDEWKRRAMRAMEEHLAEELDKLDYLERESWEAWERSQKDAETIETTERVTKALAGVMAQTARGKQAPKKSKAVTTKVEGRVGDARFLMIVRDCVAKRSELLGVSALNKPADPDKPFEMQEDVRARIATRLAALSQPVTQAPGIPVPDPAVPTGGTIQ